VSVDVVTEMVIERPPDDVAAFAADPANAPRWYVNIEAIEWKTQPPAASVARARQSHLKNRAALRRATMHPAARA